MTSVVSATMLDPPTVEGVYTFMWVLGFLISIPFALAYIVLLRKPLGRFKTFTAYLLTLSIILIVLRRDFHQGPFAAEISMSGSGPRHSVTCHEWYLPDGEIKRLDLLIENLGSKIYARIDGGLTFLYERVPTPIVEKLTKSPTIAYYQERLVGQYGEVQTQDTIWR